MVYIKFLIRQQMQHCQFVIITIYNHHYHPLPLSYQYIMRIGLVVVEMFMVIMIDVFFFSFLSNQISFKLNGLGFRKVHITKSNFCQKVCWPIKLS